MADIELVIEQSEIIINIDQAPATGGGGTTDHAAMSHLDYANSGHTGFEPAKGSDDNYVTDTEKSNLHAPGSDDQDLSGLQATSQKGAANGYAPLDSNTKIASTYLPSYVDDVLEAYIVGSTPLAPDWLSLTVGGVALTPVTGVLYVIITAGTYINKEYRWSGSTYIELVASPGSSDAVTEGTTNKYFTESRVLATIISGLSTATNAVIAATDSVLQAFGKLQAQITFHKSVTYSYALSDMSTDITVASKITDQWGFGFTVTEIWASLKVAATGAIFIINIKKNGTTIFSTRLTIDASEKTSRTAATAYVLTSAPLIWANNDEMEILVDQVGATIIGQGCILHFVGYNS